MARRHFAALVATVCGSLRGAGEGRQVLQIAVGGREEMVSIDRLKPHLGAGPFSAALPAACGRHPVSAPVVFQPQHPAAAATTGGPCRVDE
jgi:hypothetical protein